MTLKERITVIARWALSTVKLVVAIKGKDEEGVLEALSELEVSLKGSKEAQKLREACRAISLLKRNDPKTVAAVERLPDNASLEDLLEAVSRAK